MSGEQGAVVARYDDVARDRGPRTCLSLAVQRLNSAIEWAPHSPDFALADINAARDAIAEAEAAISDRLAADPPVVPPQRVRVDYGDSRLPARFWGEGSTPSRTPAAGSGADVPTRRAATDR